MKRIISASYKDDTPAFHSEKFDSKWKGVSVEQLSDEQLKQFKQDCFEMYETIGFSETFHTPYDDSVYHHNGKPFKVLRRATVAECDIEAIPIWVVQFENEPEPYFCYPEEICKI